MSVIQKIQEKYAKLMAIIIALALIIFVVMLAFENGKGLIGGNSTTVGKVNGTKIDYVDFRKKSEEMETYMRGQGYPSGSGTTQMAYEQAWNQEVNRVVMEDQFDRLGLQIGKKEIGDILYGANPPQDLAQSFTDPQTKVYNAAQAKQQIESMLKRGTAEQKAQVSNYINSLEISRLNQKYGALLTASTNTPKWLVEKQNEDESQMAKISYVRELYPEIVDSTIKVTDAEIQDYINKHKEDFKQEESRSIEYVSFNASATAADTAAAKQKLEAMREPFRSATDVSGFIQSQGLDARTYSNSFKPAAQIQLPFKDTMVKLETGALYGPYLDGTNYSLARMVAKRTQPDSVTIRHILIATAQQDQTGQMAPTKDTAVAAKLVDSIQTAIKNGANFDSLCAKFSEDGTKDKGGLYQNVKPGAMVGEFDEFIFGHPVGSKGIVKTMYGYHYIEILSAKGAATAYNIAFISSPIEVSPETDQAANNAAAQFAGNAHDQKSFDVAAEKLKERSINKVIANDIQPNAYNIQGLGVSRPYVRAIYDAKKGEVLQPEKIGDNWVVGVVTGEFDKGTQSPSAARPIVEPLLKKHKQAELIAKKLGAITTLEAAAATLGKAIEVADSVRLIGIRPPALSLDNKVVGAAFNVAFKGKVIPKIIEDQNGVYVVRVDNVMGAAVLSGSIEEQRKALSESAARMAGQSQQALVDAADVTDNRRKFF